VEGRGIEVDSKQLINGCQAGWVANDGVIRGSQSVLVFVPWGRAREDNLDQDSRDVHVSKGACPDGQRTGRTPDEHAGTHDDGGDVVDDAVGDPGYDVEDRVLVGREDVAQVGAVEDVLEGG